MRSVRHIVTSRDPVRAGGPYLGDDAGFTFIELMVVLIIVAILPAIAIPTFLGATGGANSQSAQSNLNTALTTAKAYARRNGESYGTGGGGTALTATQMVSNEHSLPWVSGPTAVQGAIQVWVSTDSKGIILASPSKNAKTCWQVVDNLAYVTGRPTTKGMYSDTTASPGVGGSTATAPTKAGVFYGKATTTTCNAATLVATSGSNVALVWASSFTGV